MSKKKPAKSKHKAKGKAPKARAAAQQPNEPPRLAQSPADAGVPAESAVGEFMAFDRHALTRARSQWQFGDWQSLAEIDSQTLDHHPHRAELALLAAAGHLQTREPGARATARTLIQQGLEAGADRRVAARLLLGGVHTNLGKAAALAGKPQERVLEQFQKSIEVGTPGADAPLLARPVATKHLLPLAPLLPVADLLAPPRSVTTQGPGALAKHTSHTHEAPEQPTDLDEPEAPLFHSHIKVNEQSFPVGFYPNNTAFYSPGKAGLAFRVPEKKAGYLVNNETGDYNQPPKDTAFPVQPGTAYEFDIQVPTQGGERPVFWVFEYNHDQKQDSHSHPTESGQCSGLFKTGPNTTRVTLGIRLAGEGILNPTGCRFWFKTGPDIAIAERLRIQIRRLGTELESSLRKQQQKQAENDRNQIEALLRLQSHLGTDFILPEMHGWAISPDLGMLITRLIERNEYDAVIEFGSGASTMIIARALAKRAPSARAQPTPFISFEHLEHYLEHTARNLEEIQLRDAVDIRLAPLIPYRGPDGGDYHFYDCSQALSNLKNLLHAPANPTSSARPVQPLTKILVFIDGPPGRTAPRARYPALPILQGTFAGATHLDVLLDDYVRDDEQQIVLAWESFLDQRGISFNRQEFPKLEKKACLLRIDTGADPLGRTRSKT